MAAQNFVWTCLPNRLSEDEATLRLSVLCSPRLDPGDDSAFLASFPDWLDWPAAVAGAEFTFFANSAPVAASAIGRPEHDAAVGAPDSAVWTAVFGPGLKVTPYKLNEALLESRISSYSAIDLHELARDLYAELARRSGEALPRIGADLLGDPRWRRLVDAVDEVDRWGTSRYRGGIPHDDNIPADADATQSERRYAVLAQLADFAGKDRTATGDLAALATHLARFELFHTPPFPSRVEKKPRPDDPRIEAATRVHDVPEAPKTEAELAADFDFHRVVASMNGYPTLLRRLGLVVDFRFGRGAFPKGDFDLRVEARFAAGLATERKRPDLTPVTKVGHDERSFAARSRVSPGPGNEMRVEAGLLDLYGDPEGFAVLNADVDGAGLKLMNFARSLGRHDAIAKGDRAHHRDDVSHKEKRAGAPALRTAGLMLVRRNRAAALKARLAQGAAQAKGAALEVPVAELWGEDLVRGYRIDVWDGATGVWRSLCRRRAEYTLAGGIVVTPAGGEEEATVQLAATKSPDKDYNPDVLSLHEALVSWTGWSLAAPPPGKGVGVDTGAAPGGKPAFTDGAAPVAGLELRSRFRPSPGSLPRLRYGRTYAVRARAVDLAGNSLPPREDDYGPERPADAAQPFLRFEPLAAPVIALPKPRGLAVPALHEGEAMHRMVIRSFNAHFDDPARSTERARRVALAPQVSVREAELLGALDRGGRIDRAAFPMLASEKDLVGEDPGAAVREEPIVLPGAKEAQRFAVWQEGQPSTWLPDPMARAVSARFLGHPAISEAESIEIDLYPGGAVWPDAEPFVIELFEAQSPGQKPRFDAGPRVLRVPLAKGDRATLRLSMLIGKDDLFGRMGLWQWLDQPTRDGLAEAALAGRCWLLTPWQDIELVHAVQRPLVMPRIDALLVDRTPGDTHARPRFVARCSVKSTDRLDLLAAWNDPLDDPAETGPGAEARDDLAFHVKLTPEAGYEPGPDAAADHAPPVADGAADLVGVNAASDLVAVKAQDFADTRYRRVTYRLDGTTRFRDHLPQAIVDQPPEARAMTLEGPLATGWVPNSAPPPAPKLLYVVPTFGWVRAEEDDGTARSWRRGGGLRVYLDRPWNATGFGEMLAVVLPPKGYAGDPEADARYRAVVTQWAGDPIWVAPSVAGASPAPDRFPLARFAADPSGSWLPPDAPESEALQPPGRFETALRLPGEGTPLVEVVPHDVRFDPERRLWFADIEIDPGEAYWPFVRLALARYQPCSTDGAHLSEVALADFMQLAADRSVVVRPDRDPRVRHVAVFGPGYTGSGGAEELLRPMSVFHPLTGGVSELPAISPRSLVEVWIEELEPALGADFGWRRIGDGVPDAGPAEEIRPPAQDLAGARLPAPEDFLLGRRLLAERRFETALASGLAGDRIRLRPALWEGSVTLPAASPKPLRLVVAEYEEYPVDAPSEADPDGLAAGRRLVFVEHLPLVLPAGIGAGAEEVPDLPALRSSMLIGDPVLTECLQGSAKLAFGSDGVPVARLQAGLIEAGVPVGPKRADGEFGKDTAAAVAKFKTAHGLVPSDPVVGPGTTRELDDRLRREPADTARFGVFAPMVRDRRLEQFAAVALLQLLGQPTGSWSADVAEFARKALDENLLIGIATEARKWDLFPAYEALDSAVNTDERFRDDTVLTAPATFTLVHAGGDRHAMILLREKDTLGRTRTTRDKTGLKARRELRDVLVHELTHARNVGDRHLENLKEADPKIFLDPKLAQQLGASKPMRYFVTEFVARHVSWVVLKEFGGKPGDQAVAGLVPENLAVAAREYFYENMHNRFRNGYTDILVRRGDKAIFAQAGMWLRQCSTQLFATGAGHQALSKRAFLEAADLCDALALSPFFDENRGDGIHPLGRDFTER